MWQFIPSTGRLYDLDINWWQDGRRDVVRSTEAAMDYLERLNRMFDGDWLLALAAYNAGEGSVTRAMEKNRKKGLATDFWSLKLKSETSAYVPKMIALTQLLRDPQKYQFSWRPIANEARFARVEIGSQLDLKLASELAGISSEQMYQLNPHFARWATDPQGPHELLIPIDSVERFRSALETLPPEKRVQWGTYTVKSGDTLGAIAKKHRTSVAQLQRSNHIKGTNIRKGQTLLIPKQGGNPTRDMQLADAPRAQTRHDSQGRHTVQEGENLWSIARANGLTVAELRKRNALDEGSLLKVGQVLYVGPTAQGAQTTAASLTGNPHLSTRKMQYTVRSGDSLARIASKFGVSVRELSQWNNWDRNRVLKPGQRLTIYVDQTRLSGG
jgi:membrane-bound lytic murein transglycosylase D